MPKSSNLHFIYIILDAVMAFSIALISFLAFYGLKDFTANVYAYLIYAGSISLLTVISFFVMRIYKIITMEIGIFEALKIMLTTLVVHVIGLIVLSFVPYLPEFSPYLATWVLSTLSLLFLHPSMRVAVRVFNIANIVVKKTGNIPTIVIGAGATGKIVVDESRRNKSNHNKIIAIVDDDPNKIGGLFSNLPVKGPISDIAKIIDYTHAQEVIIAISDVSNQRLREIISLLSACNVRVRRMPLLSEMQGPNDTRIIDVDINDLLSREPVVLDNQEVKHMLFEKTVLVTGAGGSIGSELTRQIFKTHPKKLILFDIYENSTYDIQMELVRKMREENIKDVELVTLIGSTYNEFRVEQIMKKYRPDFIYHAAAYKHVPLMEDSPAEAIRTNVIGTYNVAKLADKYGVKKMVLVSTDKAVRPTSVMGATKRFAEIIVQYYSSISKNTRYAAVRFGNVLGSNGSVVPLFKKQIEDGGPITITDKRIIRYFMTIPEAVSLILQCGLFADGGEIFVLDMGQPVKIIDLAEKLIRQAGLVPNVDIEIVETGLRPGEKLFEELLISKDIQKETKNEKIFIEVPESINENVESDVAFASKAFEVEECKDVKDLLSKIIKTYHSPEKSEGK